MRIIDHKNEFHISWQFDHWHKRNLEAVKSIGHTNLITHEFICGAKYTVDIKNDKKFWRVDKFYRDQVERLQHTHNAQIVVADAMKPELIGDIAKMPELQVTLPMRDGTVLRHYQQQGIQRIIDTKKILIGDEQGLGKTIQAILSIAYLKATPTIVICPSSTKENWKREIEKFSHLRCLVLGTKTQKNWHSYVAHGLVDVVIVNYESVSKFFVESFPNVRLKNGRKKSWTTKDIVLKSITKMFIGGILDESHRCKDGKTNQTKFIARIFIELQYRLLLSGTSVINKPIDLLPQLAMLGALKYFGDAHQFKDRYCEGGAGSNNLRELNYKLNAHCFFRREKKDVAKDLPDKQRQTIMCEISNRDEYSRAENDFKKWLKDQGLTEDDIARKMGGEAIVKMMNLKTIAAKGKMNEVTEFVNEVLESGEKLILFCHLHSIVDACLAIWSHAVTITGRDSMEQRQRSIDRFQNDSSCQLIICNHKAAGVGITLTASSRVAFIEYPWTYADCVQCEDRAHRIGQKNNVLCTYFLGQETVDERLWQLIMQKMHIGNTITGATDRMSEMTTIDKTETTFINQ